jgi:asparagine synthase (glutamine-hydrolysing)
MCGIAGLLDIRGWVDVHLIIRMMDLLSHRGPDDEGYLLVNIERETAISCRGKATNPALGLPPVENYIREPFNLALGHRRLAIINLSSGGHQPMSSIDKRLWIVFNGEIYNYLELRNELTAMGYRFNNDTDTEVILAAYDAWGVGCLLRFNGMWAFALWDSAYQRLLCARDRFGIKPFYYYFDGRQFRFASEIKAILPNFATPPIANDHIIFDYLAHGQVGHSTETFFRGIHQLAPAHYLVFDVNDLQSNAVAELAPRRYWDLNPEYRIEGLTDTQYARRFYELLEDSIRLHLRSDVPIGSCLSGGLDSSTIVCIANCLLRQDGTSTAPIEDCHKTFSSCFDDERFDERQYITEVLALIGAESNYVFPDGRHLVQELSQIVRHQDEPFGSTSIYAQWSVFCRAAERGIKVMLDGQGGDELLAGYLSYYPYYHLDLLARGAWKTFWNEWRHYLAYQHQAPIPSLHTLFTIGTSAWLNGPKHLIKQLLGTSANKLYPWLLRDYIRMYAHKENRYTSKFDCLFREALYQDLVGWLPSLLRYEDRDSMAFSIEARVPFLDYRLVEYVFALPADQKIRAGLTKFILREATRGVIPAKVRQRTDKMGFETPEAIWFRQYLAMFAREVIHSVPQPVKVYFDPLQVERLIDEATQEEASDRTCNTLWRILNLCLWFDIFHVSVA